jgi:hypothetical protein
VITVTGKAFCDVAHGRRIIQTGEARRKGYAVWEIHPVMKMEVIP